MLESHKLDIRHVETMLTQCVKGPFFKKKMEKKIRQMETSKAMESKIHDTYHLPTLNMEKYYFAAKSFELHTCMIC